MAKGRGKGPRTNGGGEGKRAAPARGQVAPARPSAPAPDAEEDRLAALLFGSAAAAPDARATAAAARVDSAPTPPPPAWHDADDDALEVDLRGTARLRKLRTAPEEGVVSGASYAARLRAQFESTSGGGGAGGRHAWAALPTAPSGGARKRQRVTAAAGAGAAAWGGRDGEDAPSEEEGEGEETQGVEDDDNVLRSTGALLQPSTALPATVLSLSRCRDANVRDPARSTIRAIAWHPTPDVNVLLVGSDDSRVRFFRCDGEDNSCLTSVHLRDMPVGSAGWVGDGTEVIATGRRPFFYTFDLATGKAHRVPRLLGRDEASLESAVISPASPASSTSLIAFLGNDGTTILASARTKQWVANVRHANGSVRAAAFSRGSTGGGGGAGPLDYPELLTVGSHGEVHVWDLRSMRARVRVRDEGSTGGSSLAVHPSGASFAVGSTCGIVNVYDSDGVGMDGSGSSAGGSRGHVSLLGGGSAATAPKPTHTLTHLTTAIDHLAYGGGRGGGGGGGEMLLMSSSRERDALRAVHTGSGTVFANWPTRRTPLAYVTAGASLSPGGGLLAMGSDTGRALLYRLNHYA